MNVGNCVLLILLLLLSIIIYYYVGQGDSMLVIGHRGSRGYEPENTLLSFKKALEIGVDMIEFDVRKASTGELIVMHDATVNRTTNGTGAIINMTFEQLRQLDAGKGQKIPTLREVLDLVDRKARLNIEIKAAEVVADLSKIIHEYIDQNGWQASDFLVSSFNLSSLSEFHLLAPEIQLMAIFSKVPDNWIEIVQAIPADLIAISAASISKKIIDLAHRNEIEVVAYTVNEPKDIVTMIKLGVDGICSDYPDRIRKVN